MVLIAGQATGCGIDGQVILRIFSQLGSDDGGVVVSVPAMWNEQTTWRTRPSLINVPIIATIGPVRSNVFIKINITDAIKADGSFSIAIMPSSKSDVDAAYSSREADAAHVPQLVVRP